MKILVIEDDATLNNALKMSLQMAGFTVDGFTDGKQGEQHFAMHNMDYDLLILDLELPGRHGSEICKNIRANKITTPILILTGHDELVAKVSLLNAGADDYLTKPFSIPELVARVRALLRRPVQALPTELTHKDLVLNPTTRQVTRGGNVIPITLKEFSILEYFMRRPGEVISRDQLLDHAWDFNFSSFSNIIDVHITNLRKKLEVDGEKYFETIRGVGYRLKK